MADIKISALPEAPINWKLNDILAVVDSGNTTTSKQTLEYLFGNWSGQTITDSSNQYFIAGNGTQPGKIIINGTNRAVIVASTEAEINGGAGNFIAAAVEDGAGHAIINNGTGTAIIATRGYHSINNSSYSGMFASKDIQLNGNECVFSLGAGQSYIGNNGYFTGAIAVNANSQINNCTTSVLIADKNCQVNLQGSNNGVIIGSIDSTDFTISNNSEISGVYSSYQATLAPNNFVNNIWGSYNCRLNDANNTGGTIVGNIFGSKGSVIETTGSVAQTNMGMFNTNTSSIVGTSLFMNTIIGSDNADINGGSNNTIIGCTGPTITGLDDAVLIGIFDGLNDAIYTKTVHMDNLYSFGRIQTETKISTTVANVQTLTGGEGMTQYTDVSAGNLNLAINGVRNGEVYHWVIDNTSGGAISVNSTSTDTGFTITDNTANTLTAGPHIFTIVVVNNKIIIEGTH